jgi:hypothetical protein
MSDAIRRITIKSDALSKNPGPEGPALDHPRGVKCAERRRKEVVHVFERPYLRKNSTPPECGGKYFVHMGKPMNSHLARRTRFFESNKERERRGAFIRFQII